MLAEDGLPVRLRTFYLDDEHITTLATRAREHQQQASAGVVGDASVEAEE